MNFLTALLPALLIAALGFAAPPAESRPIISVNCDKGRSLAKAVKRARAGSLIAVRGTCHERIVIARDGVRLVGHGHAAVDGSEFAATGPLEFTPLIEVRDAQGVLIRNLTIRNSPGEGIVVAGQSSVSLVEVTATGNANVGLLVDHARAEVSNSSFDGNASGIDGFNNASIVLRDDISLNGNLGFGIAASNAASIELRGAHVRAENNVLGVLVESGQLAIFNFGVSQGSVIDANGNSGCGLVIVGGGFMDVIAPPPLFFSGINVINAQNNGCGVLMTTGSKIESPFGAGSFNFTGNGAGMQITSNSNVTINGGLNVTANLGPGLVADGAGTILLAPADGSPPPPLASTIAGNGGPDVVMNFGSRATFATNVTVGTIACDSTVLVRGNAACP